ncbi:MAG: AbrB/MazE/SpoVT family DNA-binding domain-containing protein [Bacillota bacterium]
MTHYSERLVVQGGGFITLPENLRRMVGVKSGDLVVMYLRDGQIVMQKKQHDTKVLYLRSQECR